MTFKEIVNKYPIVNTDWWECNHNHIGSMSHRIMAVTGINTFHGIKYTRGGIKNGIYECTRIDGVNGGSDVYIMVTSVEGNRVWCMDVFER